MAKMRFPFETVHQPAAMTEYQAHRLASDHAQYLRRKHPEVKVTIHGETDAWIINLEECA